MLLARASLPHRRVRNCRGRSIAGFALLLVSGMASPAAAQVGADLSIESDDRFRGRSLSAGQPVATLDLSYDHDSGLYAGGAATGVATGDDGTQLLSLQGYAGYARRLTRTTSLDLGVTSTHYTSYFSGGRAAGYTEAYIGVIAGPISAHLRYAPDYFSSHVSTLYGEIDAVLKPSDNWRLNGHFGVLTDVRAPANLAGGEQHYDWRVGVSRLIGHLDLHLSYDDAAPGGDYYNGRPHSGAGVTVGATYSF